MTKVGSPYLPFNSDAELVSAFLDPNGDWRNLPQVTIMYYSVRLLQIRYRLYANLAAAPVATQMVLQGLIEKLDAALKNIDDSLKGYVAFSEVEVPKHLENHPFVHLIKTFLSRGMNLKRAIDATANEVEVPEKLVYKFIEDNHIKFGDEINPNSKPYRDGFKKGNDKLVKSDLLSVLCEAKKSGYGKPGDMVNFIKGFCQSNKSVDFSVDCMTTVSEGIHTLVNAELGKRGKITSDILNNISHI